MKKDYSKYNVYILNIKYMLQMKIPLYCFHGDYDNLQKENQ